MAGDLPGDFGDLINAYIARTQSEGKPLASRQSSQATLNAIGPALPELLGGSADLTPSNGTLRKDSVALTPETPGGNYLHFGVREFGMSAILNGITAHGGFIPYAGTFLTFSDYARNAVRMAALMRLRVIFVYTHDSIGLGEDGPTHQPIEHVASLRLIPHMDLWRPCDAVETATAWAAAIENRDGPTCLIFTRQSLVHEARSPMRDRGHQARRLRVDRLGRPAGRHRDRHRIRGGHRGRGSPHRGRQGKKSPPGFHAEQHDLRATGQCVQASVLPPSVTRRVAVEAGATDFWWRYVGLQGEVIGIDHFGASAPAKELFKAYGFTPERVAEAIDKVSAP